MNIVVCIKQVPDTTAKREFTADFRLNRQASDGVINPFDEYAIEEALRLKEDVGGEVTLLSMGPAAVQESLRKALAMGADRAILISDPALEGTDWFGTSMVLAQALRAVPFDLIITGMESTDARTGMVPGGLAENLDLPLLTYASQVQVQEHRVRVNRQIAGGYQEIEADMPALISVVKGANEPRYPSLKGIMAAKRKEIQVLGLSELGIDSQAVGLNGAKCTVTRAEARVERQAGQVSRPDSPQDAARILADFLQQRKFI